MKTILLALSLLVVYITLSPLNIKEGRGSLAYADDLAIAETLPETAHTISGGVIKTVSWADPVKGTRSEIVVLDPAGSPTHIFVTSTTTLWDADAKAITQDKLIASSKVNVIYFTTPEGINIGKSIKILKTGS